MVPGESASKVERTGASGAYSQPAFESSSIFASLCVTPAGDVLRANRAFLDIVGCDSAAEFASRSFRSETLIDPEDWDLFERAAAGQRIMGEEIALRAAGDRQVVLKGDIWSVAGPRSDSSYILGAFVDITEARLFRTAVQRAARSEAICNLASGMIHDFKNLLTVLVGNLYLIAEGVRDRPELLEQAKRARDVARRGAELTQEVLSFAREGDAEARSIDPGQLVSNLQPMLAHAVGSRRTLALDIAAEVPAVRAGAAQLESVILNLVINARDAIAESGRITIRLQDVALDESEAERHRLPAGRFVRIAVEDDGEGIPEALHARIFEPFFSTKGEGRGTGLGLTMVRWFAESAGGAVEIESQAGRGTRIGVLLPCAAEAPDTSSSMTMPLSSLPGGSESVLVVAGDRTVADTLRDSLAVLGYSVHLTHDCSQLSALLARNDFDLVMLDSSADSNASPARLAAAIRQKYPDLAALLVQGSDARDTRSPGRAPVLPKPFTLKDLATLVRRTLDGEPSD